MCMQGEVIKWEAVDEFMSFWTAWHCPYKLAQNTEFILLLQFIAWLELRINLLQYIYLEHLVWSSNKSQG